MRNHTKKALVLSVLSLVLCVSMLVGTTFAWFTDSVTTGVNVIQSGTLDVDMVKPDGSAIGDKLYFRNAQGSSDILWEPGAMFALDSFKIVNKGNLALKYALYINGLSGDAKLLEAIDFYVTIGDVAYANVLANGTALNLFNATNVKLLPNTSSEKITLWGKMKEEAGNEYQGLFIDGISITVLATQVTEENDSFDNQYDKDATYANIVKTEADLAVALRIGGLIELADDITVEKTLTVPAGVVATLNLNGKTLSGAGIGANGKVNTIVNNGTLTVADGTVASVGVNGGSAIYNYGILTLNNAIVNGAPTDTATGTASYAVNNAGAGTVLTVNDSDVTGRGVIGVTNGAKAIINGGRYHTPAVAWGHAVYANGEGTEVIINGGTFSEGYAYAATNWGMYQIYAGNKAVVTVNGGDFSQPWDCSNGVDLCTATEGKIVINAGIFADDPSSYAKGQVVDNGNGTWTVKPYEVSNAADLVDNLANGKPVVLTDDIAFNTTLSIEKDAYIDANGKTIKFTSGSSTRFIDVPNTANGANLTIKNAVIDIDGSYCQRGINYNTNGTLLLDNVTLTGSTKATYGINMPSSSANATVEMTNCDITALIALNIWGENVVVNVKDCNLSNYDNNSTEGEDYATVKLNNDGTYAANGAIVTITGGSITAKDETGADFIAINNNTATGVVVVSDTTVVNGIVETNVATIHYKDGNGNFYNEFYGAATLQDAVTMAAKSANAEVFLLTDITVDTLDVPANVIIHKNGHALTIGATTGSGILNIVD